MVEVVKRTFIAGVLIQASWFITAVAVDISTIATYGVGGLPISIMGEVSKNGNSSNLNLPVLTNEIIVELEGSSQTTVFLSTAENDKGEVWKISPCWIRRFQDTGS